MENILLSTHEFPVSEILWEKDKSTQTLRTLSLRFPSVPLWPRQIPKWRGAVIESAGPDKTVFHNHDTDTNECLYRPALIQYRCANGQAIVWGMNEGADALLEWQSQAAPTIIMNGRTYPLEGVELLPEKATLAIDRSWHYYNISDYLALNDQNYKKWSAESRLMGRIAILENALTAHLLAFCKAAGWWLPQRLELEIVALQDCKKTRCHQTELLAFALSYRCNLELPDGISLGKAGSHGFGIQQRGGNSSHPI